MATMAPPRIEGSVAPGYGRVRDARSSRTSSIAVSSAGRAASSTPGRRSWTCGAESATGPPAIRGAPTRWSWSTRRRRAWPRWCWRWRTRAGGRTTMSRSAPTGPSSRRPARRRITVRHLLAHQAGLFAFDEPVDRDVVADPVRLAEIMARQRPAWPPGDRQAYHAISLGFYESEIVRRVDPQPRSLGRCFAEEIAAPLGPRLLHRDSGLDPRRPPRSPRAPEAVEAADGDATAHHARRDEPPLGPLPRVPVEPGVPGGVRDLVGGGLG